VTAAAHGALSGAMGVARSSHALAGMPSSAAASGLSCAITMSFQSS
jgi:hypothetical protein